MCKPLPGRNVTHMQHQTGIPRQHRRCGFRRVTTQRQRQTSHHCTLLHAAKGEPRPPAAVGRSSTLQAGLLCPRIVPPACACLHQQNNTDSFTCIVELYPRLSACDLSRCLYAGDDYLNQLSCFDHKTAHRILSASVTTRPNCLELYLLAGQYDPIPRSVCFFMSIWM